MEDPIMRRTIILAATIGIALATDVPATTCTPSPRTDCAVAPAGASTLTVKDRPFDPQDQLAWSMKPAGDVTLANLGTPLDATGYALCLYDGQERVLAADAPAGGTCRTKPCWKAGTTGYGYKDSERSPSGVDTVKLKSGAAGKARLQVKAKGDALGDGALPLTGTVTAQLQADGGSCWSSTYGTAATSNALQYQAVSNGAAPPPPASGCPADPTAGVIRTIGDPITAGMDVDGDFLAVGPDGTIVFSFEGGNGIGSRTPGGAWVKLAGQGGYGEYSGDGGPAIDAAIYSMGIAVGPDGSIFMADDFHYRVRRIDPAGIIGTIAGTGNGGEGYCYTPVDGQPATDVVLIGVESVSTGADGSVYLSDPYENRVLRVTPDGVTHVIAGSPDECVDDGFSGDGGPAIEAQFSTPVAVAGAPDGSVYVWDSDNYRIRRIGPDGIVDTVLVLDGWGSVSDLAMAVAPDGSLYVADDGNNRPDFPLRRIRRIAPDGQVTTIAGTGDYGLAVDGQPAITSAMEFDAIAVGPDCRVYFIDDAGIRYIE